MKLIEKINKAQDDSVKDFMGVLEYKETYTISRDIVEAIYRTGFNDGITAFLDIQDEITTKEEL